MKFDPQKHHRASARLKGHDYSFPGAYFITLVAFQREMLFGEIVNGEMILNPRGEIIQEEWFASTAIRKEIRLFPEEFVVMPNHIHGIVWIVEDADHSNIEVDGQSKNLVGAAGRPNQPVRADGRPPLRRKPRSLGSFVAGYKSAVTKRIRDELPALSEVEGNETGIWQRNYHDRVIRNERELDAIRRYIEANPRNWEEDEENIYLGN